MEALPALFATQAISEVGSAYEGYSLNKANDRLQRAQASVEQSQLEMKAKDALSRGAQEEGGIRRKTKAIRGAQRAGYAGQGVLVDAGTPSDIGAETELYGEMDAITARNNAWREAWGYRSQAQNIALESRMASSEAKRQRRMTLVTGGLKAAQSGFMAYAQQKQPSPNRMATERRFSKKNPFVSKTGVVRPYYR